MWIITTCLLSLSFLLVSWFGTSDFPQIHFLMSFYVLFWPAWMSTRDAADFCTVKVRLDEVMCWVIFIFDKRAGKNNVIKKGGTYQKRKGCMKGGESQRHLLNRLVWLKEQDYFRTPKARINSSCEALSFLQWKWPARVSFKLFTFTFYISSRTVIYDLLPRDVFFKLYFTFKVNFLWWMLHFPY